MESSKSGLQRQAHKIVYCRDVPLRHALEQGIKYRTFKEWVTRVHDMELSIVNRGAKDLLVE